MYYLVNVESGRLVRVFRRRSDAKRCARRLLKKKVPVVIVERKERGERR